jgi:hypothetical protein
MHVTPGIARSVPPSGGVLERRAEAESSHCASSIPSTTGRSAAPAQLRERGAAVRERVVGLAA